MSARMQCSTHWRNAVVMFATLSGAVALGGFMFLFGNQGGEHTELAVLLGAGGALTGGLLAYRHYRVFA